MLKMKPVIQMHMAALLGKDFWIWPKLGGLLLEPIPLLHM